MLKLTGVTSRKLYFVLTIAFFGFSSCYKDPFQNEEAIMVGKWKLISISKLMSNSIDQGELPVEIPFEFIFEIKEEGILKEYIDNQCTDRWRIRSNRIYENDGYIEKISLSIFKFHGLNYEENRQSYAFFFKGLDTLVSTSYLPERLYSSSGNHTFTFVKIE